ncbi:hypothetical protein VTK26DRAFT_4029 [Humicola hyalothermophila]
MPQPTPSSPTLVDGATTLVSTHGPFQLIMNIWPTDEDRGQKRAMTRCATEELQPEIELGLLVKPTAASQALSRGLVDGLSVELQAIPVLVDLTWHTALLVQIPCPTLAALTFTQSDYYIQPGVPFTITWTNNRGPVTITLMKGPDANLQPVLVVVADYESQEFTWTPPPTLPADSYELQIEDGSSVDYSPRFRYEASAGKGISSGAPEHVSPTPSSLFNSTDPSSAWAPT